MDTDSEIPGNESYTCNMNMQGSCEQLNKYSEVEEHVLSDKSKPSGDNSRLNQQPSVASIANSRLNPQPLNQQPTVATNTNSRLNLQTMAATTTNCRLNQQTTVATSDEQPTVNPGPNYNLLMQHIHTLSDLQNNDSLHNSDPSLQVAYVSRLKQQAASIKNLLKLLNTEKSSNSSPLVKTIPQETQIDDNYDVSSLDEASGGYESLWEGSRVVENIDSVNEVEDVLDDQQNLYENTCVGAENLTLSIEHPPPLPPRLPAVNDITRTEEDLRSYQKPGLSNGQEIHLECSNSSFIGSNHSSTHKTSEAATPSKSVISTTNQSGVSATTTNFNGSLHSLSSKEEERQKVDQQKINHLKNKREELITSLQVDERERQWHYTQLELISQKIRTIPLTSSQSYCLDNELQRQQLEERAGRVQASMLAILGRPEEALARRRERVQAIANIDSQLVDLDMEETRGEGRQEGGSRRTRGRRSERQPQSCNLEQLYHQALPGLDKALSHSGPPALALVGTGRGSLDSVGGPGGNMEQENGSVISFTSSIHSVGEGPRRLTDSDIDSRVEATNSLMSLLGCTDIEKMSRTLLAMSSSQANCDMMRNSRCIPLLVQLLHLDPLHPNNPRPSRPIRARAARSLHNIVHAHPNDRHGKREAKVLKLLEVLRQYCDFLRDVLEASVGSGAGKAAVQRAGCRRVTIQVVEGGEKYAEQDLMVCEFGEASNLSDSATVVSGKHVFACHNFLDYSGEARKTNLGINIEETMAILTRCSFDESHRQPIFLLGGIPTLAELIKVENQAHCVGVSPSCHSCREVRRYAVVALTNLTFGNASIKSYLCSFPDFVEIMVSQLDLAWENLRKATAHLFRNLAWKADKTSKQVLSKSRVVSVLIVSAMSVSSRSFVETAMGLAVEPGRDEPTIKVMLSALWNLSAHCRKNKSDICAIEGSLVFLVQLLRSRSTAVVENGGGILRNVSSYIATSQHGEEFRKVLREENCLALLLSQLRSPSLTIVSNSCGTLWNFSARSSSDQEALWELGAVPMLQSLTNSKHKTISTCSLAALKNLYTARPAGLFMMISGAGQTGGQLSARKVKNLVADLDEKLSDCSGRDVEGGTPQDSPVNTDDNDSGSDEDVGCKKGQFLTGSNPSLNSSNSAQRTSQTLDSNGSTPLCDRKNLFLKGMSDVAKQNGISTESLGKALPSLYQQPSYQSQHSDTESPPPSHSYTRGSLSAEGRFEGNYTSYLKQGTCSGDYSQGTETSGTDMERVMSPSNLSSVLSPASTPLDLTKKKSQFGEEEPEGEEKPTDYSLRFQESEEQEIIASKSDTKVEPLFDDTVKTYCTEGTPMDTPFIFSTATSMNDLREPVIEEENEEEQTNENEIDIEDSTVAYAVEGTPVTFSRAESLSELDFVAGSKLVSIPEVREEKGMTETEGEKPVEESKTPPPKEKTVKFLGDEDTSTSNLTGRNPYETPMMFSRASSIASLDSFDQHSMKDGYSSYEASRATSGRVSPSDLPDSPSQTMPGSPRHSSQGASRPPKHNSFPPLVAVHKKPMFEDGLKSYQEEGTPAVFSTRTSLSGLDMEEDEIELAKEKQDLESNKNDSSILSEDEDIYADSESLLGQLIHSAMPNSKSSPVKSSRLPRPKHVVTNTISYSPEVAAAGSDDSTCSAENQDILEACIASAMPSHKPQSRVNRSQEGSNQRSPKPLGPRMAAEGAPAPENLSTSKLKKRTSLSQNIGPGLMTRVQRTSSVKANPPKPPERRGSHLSHPCVAAAAASSGDFKLIPQSKAPVPRNILGEGSSDQTQAWLVEDTPVNFSAATSLSDLTVDDTASGHFSVDSNDGLMETRSRQRQGRRGTAPASGKETPLKYSTEDTPAVFSRNDSLSSLEMEEEVPCVQQNNDGDSAATGDKKLSSAGTGTVSSPGSFQSHLPRPSAVGRSGSSGSSTGGEPAKYSLPPTTSGDKSFNSSLSSLSIESLNNTNVDEEDLLADCISSAMPKSKSEHFDLAGTTKKSSLPKSSLPNKSKSSEKISFQLMNTPPSKLAPSGVTMPNMKQKAMEKFTMKSVSSTLNNEGLVVSNVSSNQSTGVESFPSLSSSAVIEGVVQVTQSMAEFSIEDDGITDIGPPSIMMDSLPSLTMPTTQIRRPSMPEAGERLQCRHTVSGKMGSSIPLTVRRALGGSNGQGNSTEDLVSLSSCHSNLDNIQPPSLLEAGGDMDHSMASVASISSEMAAALSGSDCTNGSASLTSDVILEIVRPLTGETLTFVDETSSTIKVSNHVNSDVAADTVMDILDVFDDESYVDQATLTAGIDSLECGSDIPDLPSDSRNTTPAQSGGSSTEVTPQTKRKLSPKERRQKDRDRYLTFTKAAECKPLKEEIDNSEEDIQDNNVKLWSNLNNGSPSSIKQRRAEMADRFLTHTITPADLPGKEVESSLTVQEEAMLESEARLVVQTITEKKAVAQSRSASLDILGRSRSASVEILRDHEMTRLEADSCQVSRENIIDELGEDDEQVVKTPVKPRICKPWESRVQQEDDSPPKGIRGRRRALYSPPMKRAPPTVTPKPKVIVNSRTSTSVSPSSSPKLVKSTRAIQLRQQKSSKRDGSLSMSPKSSCSPRSIQSPRSLNSTNSSLASPRSLTSPGGFIRGSGSPGRVRRMESPMERPGMVRQGTFTKDDEKQLIQSSSKSSLPKTSPLPKDVKSTTHNLSPKPSMFRRDGVQPSPNPRPVIAGRTKTQALREQSLTRGGVVRSSTSSNSSAASRSSITSKTSSRTSSSGLSTRSGLDNTTKRVPSISDIEKRVTNLNPSSAMIRPTSPNKKIKTPPKTEQKLQQPMQAVVEQKKMSSKKNVTSKIASLWKKVEDSKQTSKAVESSKRYKPKDKRIWLSKDQGVSNNVVNSIPPPGKLIRSGTYEKINENIQESEQQPTKPPRSRSRLSMKLSKFSLRRRGSEDQMNGNTPLTPDEPISPSDELGNSIVLLSPTSSELLSPEESEQNSRISPTFDMEVSNSRSTPSSHTPAMTTFRSPNRSPASAIVAPFNYIPTPSNSVPLKRNTSYVSSIGRKGDGEESDKNKKGKGYTDQQTSSTMVTLV